MSAQEPMHDLEDIQDLKNDEYLAYEGNDLPGYVIWMWVVSVAALLWYTWVWYLPDLSAWMSRGG